MQNQQSHNSAKFFYKNILLAAVLLCLCLSTACASNRNPYQSVDNYSSYYSMAKELQAQGRYPIAKEYFLLAMTEAKTYEEQKWLERELFAVDLQIKTLR